MSKARGISFLKDFRKNRREDQRETFEVLAFWLKLTLFSWLVIAYFAARLAGKLVKNLAHLASWRTSGV